MPSEQHVERICNRLGLPISVITAATCVKLRWMCSDITYRVYAITWCSMGQKAGLHCHTESSDLIRAANSHGTDKRVDVVMHCFDGALSLRGGHGYESRNHNVGKAASNMKCHKYKHYEALCPIDLNNSRLYEFRPLIFKSFGRWGVEARVVFKDMVERISSIAVSSYWRSRLCFAMHKPPRKVCDRWHSRRTEEHCSVPRLSCRRWTSTGMTTSDAKFVWC